MWKDSAAVSMSAFRSCHRSSLHCPLNVYSWPFLQTAFWLGVHLRDQCTRREHHCITVLSWQMLHAVWCVVT